MSGFNQNCTHFYRTILNNNKSFICDFFIQPATVVGLVSTVRKSVIATTRPRTVRIIRQKVDVTPPVLHTSRDLLVKVTLHYK